MTQQIQQTIKMTIITPKTTEKNDNQKQEKIITSVCFVEKLWAPLLYFRDMKPFGQKRVDFIRVTIGLRFGFVETSDQIIILTTGVTKESSPPILFLIKDQLFCVVSDIVTFGERNQSIGFAILWDHVSGLCIQYVGP